MLNHVAKYLIHCVCKIHIFLISKVINLRDITILLTYRTSKGGEEYILRLN